MDDAATTDQLQVGDSEDSSGGGIGAIGLLSRQRSDCSPSHQWYPDAALHSDLDRLA